MNNWTCPWTLDEEHNVWDVGCVDDPEMCFSYVPRRCPCCGLPIHITNDDDEYA